MTQSISGNNLEASMNPTFIIDALLNTAGQFCIYIDHRLLRYVPMCYRSGADAAAYAPDRRFVVIRLVAAFSCVKLRHGHRLESVTSNWNSRLRFCKLTDTVRVTDFYFALCCIVNRCVFTWRTSLPNFIPIRFETREPWAFSNTVADTRRRTTTMTTTSWVAIRDQFLIQHVPMHSGS